MSSPNETTASAAAAGLVRMAQAARRLDGWRRGVVGDWRPGKSGGVRFFVAAGVHVFPEHRTRRAVFGDGPSFERRRLVGGHAPRLRTHRVTLVSVAGAAVSAGRIFRETHLFVDDDGSARQQLVEREMAGVHDARFLYHVGDFLRPLVAAVVAAALLVAQAGRNRRRALHAPDAFPFGVGDCDVRADADLRRSALDAGRSIPVVLGHLRRLLLRQLRAGRPWRRCMSSPCSCNASASSTAYCTTTSFISSACYSSPSRSSRPTSSSRNTLSSGTRTCPTKPSGISSAKTVRGGGWACSSSSAISCCRSSCCCR